MFFCRKISSSCLVFSNENKKEIDVLFYGHITPDRKNILDYIEEGKISMGHARALIGVPDAINLAEEIINKKLSVRDIERNTSIFKKSKSKKNFKDPNIVDLERELSEKIGLKTSIHFNDQGASGSITLYYSDLDQLDDIMKRLKRQLS